MKLEDKAKLRSFSFTEIKKLENLRVVSKKGQVSILTNPFDIYNVVVQAIMQEGFSCVRCDPRSSNCVIRVFSSDRTYEKARYKIVGAEVYTKNHDGKWYTGTKSEPVKLDLRKCTQRVWFYQDEYWDAELDFFDTYMKVF